jgi:hypothetical protein
MNEGLPGIPFIILSYRFVNPECKQGDFDLTPILLNYQNTEPCRRSEDYDLCWANHFQSPHNWLPDRLGQSGPFYKVLVCFSE